jgi:uncharacterized membrane protein
MTEVSDTNATEPKPFVSQAGLALTVYVLYIVGFVTIFTTLIGLIIAYVKIGTADEVIRTHFRFQIRTFWIGLLLFVVGWLLFYLLIGIPILIWWFIWTVVRVVKGMVLLNDRKPIKKPTSWMFG